MIRVLLVFILLYSLFDTAMAAFLPKAFEATFVEEIQSAVSKKKKYQGTLEFKYQFPSQIYLKNVNSNTLYICNTSKVWKYDPPFAEGEPGMVTTGASSKYCFSKLFDSLQKGLKDNKLYTVKKIKEKNYQITFKKKARAQLDVEKLLLVFESGESELQNVSQIDVFYVGAPKPTVLKKKSFEISKGFDKSLFVFDPPPNTETQKMD